MWIRDDGERMYGEKVEKHIGVLDGIRAFSIILVVWFHFWEQSWLTPYININSVWTKYLGITSIELASYVRYGFTFVDMLILLSAFCNFYPYARALILGEEWPSTREFYYKRAVRIIPSYLLSVLVILFLFVLPNGIYKDSVYMWKDILTTFTFTRGLFLETLFSSQINGVLWTVQVEVLYYILLPFIAKLFKRFPTMTYLAMMLLGIVFVNYVIIQYPGAERGYANHMLTYMGVYANGILLSILTVTWKKSGAENRYTKLAATILSFFCIVWFRDILKEYRQAEALFVAQLKLRIPQSFLFSGFIFFTICACDGWKKIFSNKVTRFVCLISYNLYIWHQFIAFKLKEFRIPYWEGEIPPNMTGDTVWQWRYQILIILTSVITAIIVTYMFEIPIKKYCEKIKKQGGKREKQ